LGSKTRPPRDSQKKEKEVKGKDTLPSSRLNNEILSSSNREEGKKKGGLGGRKREKEPVFGCKFRTKSGKKFPYSLGEKGRIVSKKRGICFMPLPQEKFRNFFGGKRGKLPRREKKRPCPAGRDAREDGLPS